MRRWMYCASLMLPLAAAPAFAQGDNPASPKSPEPTTEVSAPAAAPMTAAKPAVVTPAKPASSEKKVSLAGVTIKGAISEASGGMGMFGEMGGDLADIVSRIDRAGKDEKLVGVMLSIRDADFGLGMANEIRGAIARTRRAGKKVYAEVHDLSATAYLVAAACDEIIMPPSGSLFIPGLRAEVTFYKNLFDKVGIKAEFLQMGKYKGAAEPFTRDKMSPEFREEYEALLDDNYNLLVETIAVDRRLPASKVRELIDVGLFSAEAAKAAGLVDRVAYLDEFRKDLPKRLGGEQLAMFDDYGKKKVDADFSGLGGMMKMMEMMMGAERPASSSKNPKIAVVYAVGGIMTGDSTESLFGGQVVGSDTLVKALRQADDDKTVKAIVLRVDSPGGSALASDLIWREIVRIKEKKPVIVSMGDVAASGGYYISMGADKIFAEPGTLTGSIGVVGGKMVLGGVYDKVGLNTEIISRGKNSGLFSSTTPFTDSERAAWRGSMEEIYKQFTTKAAEGRKMDVKKLEELAQGRVWSGRMAKEKGLIDELGTLDDALVEAKKRSGFKDGEKAELLRLPKPTSILEQMFGISAEARIKSQVAELTGVAPEILEPIAEVSRLRKLFREPGVTVLPYKIKVR
jgi:protease IV